MIFLAERVSGSGISEFSSCSESGVGFALRKKSEIAQTSPKLQTFDTANIRSNTNVEREFHWGLAVLQRVAGKSRRLPLFPDGRKIKVESQKEPFLLRNLLEPRASLESLCLAIHGGGNHDEVYG